MENTATGTLSGTRYYTIGSSGTSTSSGTTGNADDSADNSTSGSTGGGTTASNAAGGSAGGGSGSGAASSSGGGGGSSAASSGIGSSGGGSGGGATVACRTSAGKVYFLIGDQQGTAGIAIDSSNVTGTGITRRYYDPYGQELGTPPANWPGNKGFVGGTDSAATGLTNLGAREYQPQAEQFISPDSVLNPYDPGDLNAYAYAGDSPATDSDPSGQAMIDAGNGCVGSVQYDEGCTQRQVAAQKKSGASTDSNATVSSGNSDNGSGCSAASREAIEGLCRPSSPSYSNGGQNPANSWKKIAVLVAACMATGCERKLANKGLAWLANHLYAQWTYCVVVCFSLTAQGDTLMWEYSGVTLGSSTEDDFKMLFHEAVADPKFFNGLSVGVSQATYQQNLDSDEQISGAVAAGWGESSGVMYHQYRDGSRGPKYAFWALSYGDGWDMSGGPNKNGILFRF